MGNSSSQTIQQTLSIFNQNLFNAVQRITNNASATCNIAQNLSIRTDNVIFDCENAFNIGQVAACTSDLSQTFSAANSNDIANLMQAALQQTANSDSKQVNDFLSTGVSVNNQTQSLQQHVENIISTNIQSIITNGCTSYANLTQGQVLDLKNTTIRGGQCNITQSAQATAIANCLANNTLDIISRNAELIQAAQGAATKVDQENSGVGNIIGGLTTAWIIIIVIGAIVFIVIAYLLIKFAPSLISAYTGTSTDDSSETTNTMNGTNITTTEEIQQPQLTKTGAYYKHKSYYNFDRDNYLYDSLKENYPVF